MCTPKSVHLPSEATTYVGIEQKTNKLFLFHKDELSKFANSKRHRQLYKIIGIFDTEQEAEEFMSYTSLGVKPDAVAFLTLEHSCREKIAKGADITAKDLECMLEEASAVRAETGRSCFGKCGSLQQQPACALCYTTIPDTWTLCANVTCLYREFELRRAAERAEASANEN